MAKQTKHAELDIEPVDVMAPSILFRLTKHEAVELPQVITGTLRTSEYDVTIEVGFAGEPTRPGVRKLEVVDRTDGFMVTAAALNALGLGDIVRDAVQKAQWRRRWTDDTATLNDADYVPGVPLKDGEMARIFGPRRGAKVAPDEIKKAAEAYRNAAGRRDPLMVTAAAIGKSRSTAARRVDAARQLGLLGPEE